MKIVGIAGMPRSGKDSLAELFIKAGYFGISFGDVVRRYSRERHSYAPDPISVANMTETSNWLREQKGSDVILHEALQQFNDQQASGLQYEGLVLWSVRAPVEVDFILERGGELIWVEATDEVRHNRGIEHLRPGEIQITLEEFKRQEALQWQPQPGIPVDVQMNISYVKEKATRTLINNGESLGEFLHNAYILLNSMGVKY